MRKHYIYACGHRYAIYDTYSEVLEFLLADMECISDHATDTMNEFTPGTAEYNYCYGKAEAIRDLWNDLVNAFNPERVK